jgi:hypothetical protein
LLIFQAAPAKGLKNNEDYREKELECQDGKAKDGKAKSRFKNLRLTRPRPGVESQIPVFSFPTHGIRTGDP